MGKPYPDLPRCRAAITLIGAVLAAGKSTRLRPVLEGRPKPLIPSRDGTPLLIETARKLARLDELEEIVVVTGYRHEAIAEAFEDRGFDVEVTLERNEAYDELGPVASVRCALEARSVDDLLLMNGDTFFSARAFEEIASIDRGGVWLACTPVDEFSEDDVRVAIDDEGAIQAVGKGLAAGRAGARSAGLVRVRGDPAVEAFAGKVRELDREERKGGRRHIWHTVVDRLAEEGRVAAVPVEARDWFEIDTPEDYEAFRQRFEPPDR